MTGDAGGLEVPRSGWLLVIDSATTMIIVAACREDGSVLGERSAPAGYRHGELLLGAIEQLIEATGLDRGLLVGVIVGTGPGAFTGLRVGMATAKALAHALKVPIVGISTGEALLYAATRIIESDPDAKPSSTGDIVLLLPAGPRELVLVRAGEAPRIAGADAIPAIGSPAGIVAVDLDGRAPEVAVLRGATARAGLGAALAALGSARLRTGDADGAAELVPEYVTLPRGIQAATGGIEWSRDPR